MKECYRLGVGVETEADEREVAAYATFDTLPLRFRVAALVSGGMSQSDAEKVEAFARRLAEQNITSITRAQSFTGACPECGGRWRASAPDTVGVSCGAAYHWERPEKETE